MNDLWQKLKKYVFDAALTISLLFGGIIFLLMQKTKRQEQENATLESELKQQKANAEYEAQKEKANNAEEDYNRTKRFYSDLINGKRSDSDDV